MRYALGVEYAGHQYCGWQFQAHDVSVQQMVQQALSKVADMPIEVFCAGRTDAGVNATNQVIHFDCDKPRKLIAWTLGVNSNLPKDIAIKWAKPVADDFHARYSASARQYRYIINNSPNRSALMPYGLTFVHQPLDAIKMHHAAQALIGEQDFTSFRASHCQANTPFRCVHHCKVSRFGEYVMVEIKANAFLHHMVRNIVGSLIEVGLGEQPIDWLKQLLAVKDRTQAGITAPAEGLYFVGVDYPEHYQLPSQPIGPLYYPELSSQR